MMGRYWRYALRVSSIKTRIKTPSLSLNTQACLSLRVSSIKTRIKTIRLIWYIVTLVTLRVSSIKTRIKTIYYHSLDTAFPLWEYLPLKQGLRLDFLCVSFWCCVTLRVSSIKTRIKTVLHYLCTILHQTSESIFH